ncbi:energy transducer TonB [bacterium]|nr:energy transducer TonB [bacterium]
MFNPMGSMIVVAQETPSDDEPVRLQPDLSKLKAIEQHEAEFPEIAKKAFAEGQVIVEVTIDAFGMVSKASVVDTKVTLDKQVKKEYSASKEKAQTPTKRRSARPAASEEEGEEEAEETEEVEESEEAEENEEVLDEDGDPYGQIALEQKIAEAFEESALTAAKKWKFEPMKDNTGKEISVVTTLTFNFNLNFNANKPAGKK